jgi:hypothetical protein
MEWIVAWLGSYQDTALPTGYSIKENLLKQSKFYHSLKTLPINGTPVEIMAIAKLRYCIDKIGDV